MIRSSKYIYLIDGLPPFSAERLRKAILAGSGISDISIKMNSGIVEIKSKSDPEPALRMACEIAGCVLRTKLSKRKASYNS